MPRDTFIPPISQFFPILPGGLSLFCPSKMKAKEPVTLRKRMNRNGGYSLFLDYSINGIRYKDYLKMYLVPEKSKMDRMQNQQTMKAAQAAKAKLIIDLANGKADVRPAKKTDILLADYLTQVADEHTQRGQGNYAGTLKKISRVIGDFGKRLTLQRLTKENVLEFTDYLRTRFSDSTVYVYFNNLNTALNHAYRTDMINENPIRRIELRDRPQKPESKREYLSIDEVKKLIETPCTKEIVKRAFLFSCFTGLRLSDIEALTWGDIRNSGDGLQIEIKQIKTKRLVVIPLSRNALEQIPERNGAEKTDKVWALPCRTCILDHLVAWVKAAGIEKKISFHCARHTNATLLLTYGVDLYTVSSLLGHTDVRTTQIYAKIIDEKKKQAVNKIPDLMAVPAT